MIKATRDKGGKIKPVRITKEAFLSLGGRILFCKMWFN